MARNDRINALRETAKRMERNAGKKMSRLRNSARPVELSGTKFDVRRGSDISRMRSRDLERHIGKLQEFNSRKSRFMGTDAGPAGPNVVNPFLRAQRAVNKQREANLDKFGDIKMPNSDENLRQKWGVSDAAQRRMSDPSANNPFRPVDKVGIRYRTPDAIAKMTQKFEHDVEPGTEDEKREKHRETLSKILAKVDMPELEKRVGWLTDEQFDLMWYNPDFMTGQGLVYAQTIGRDKGELSAAQLEVFDQILEAEQEEALDIVNWALNTGVGR